MDKIISGWGNTQRINTNLWEEEISDYVEGISAKSNIGIRGCGRSYGDASLNTEGVIATSKLRKFIAFDANTGVLTCEAGVTFSEIVETFVPRGWFLPVTPGTKYVTVGGAIAADVHGKNHHKDGSFTEFVTEIVLLMSDGRVLTCSSSENKDLFNATCGGMGMTGLILQATFSLISIETRFIKQHVIKTRNFNETIECFKENACSTYSVAWVDCLASGESLGRSVVMLGEHAKKRDLDTHKNSPLIRKSKNQLNIPFYFPSGLLNRLTVGVFNRLYYFLQKEGVGIVDLDPYFYPLDKIHSWNRIYGKNGFFQYQFVLPMKESIPGMEEILATISASKTASFLSVLKIFGKASNEKPMSFPTEGLTLALDFPNTKKVKSLLNHLDDIVRRYKGRIYLAKDARMSSSIFKNIYKNESETLVEIIKRYEITQTFQSLLSQRLNIR